jgi:replicative DNA helicase
VTEVLTAEQIKARIQERQNGEAATQRELDAADAAARYKYVRPLSVAADGLIDFITNPDGRMMLGVSDVDAMMRGAAKGEMVFVAGRAHSGKTQLVLNAIVNNPEKRGIFFTPDEVSELVLSKLVSIRHGVNAEDVEKRIREGDDYTKDLVRRAASKDFANLVVIDETLSIDEMTQAVNEAQDYWGETVDYVVYDFLELLPGDGDAQGVSNKSKALKRWLKHIGAVGFIIHQSSKSNAPRGKSGGLDGMRYGGDTEAIFVLEVYRKSDDGDLDDFDRRRHANTVTVNLCKNKRPPSKKGEVDLYLDPATGFIRRLDPEDMVVMGTKLDNVADAYRAVSNSA